MKENFRADLHCHSTHSDGTYTPLELLHLAKKSELSALAITDHDAISAYFEIKEEAQKEEIKLLSGVELSTVLDDVQIHILGYAFDPKSSSIEEFCRLNRSWRLERNRQILEKLNQKGMKIDESEIVEKDHEYVAYGRPHIAMLMLKKGYVTSIIEAFRNYLGEGKSCYSPGKKFSTTDAIDVIHKAKGKAVIAHPHLIQDPKILDKMMQLPFDGIEAFYCHFSQGANKRWVELAESKGWFTTGGSDFHGSNKDVKLGASLTPESVFNMLWQHFQDIIL